jgi:hypothetical protein
LEYVELINFRPTKVQGRTHATSLTEEDRRRFHFDSIRWQDLSSPCRELRETMYHLLADWVACLNLGLYEQALTHFCGGDTQVIQRLPLNCKGTSLGTQRFQIHSPGIAFRVTAVTRQIQSMETHLRRLLSLTELHAMQWINLNHTEIQLATLTK